MRFLRTIFLIMLVALLAACGNSTADDTAGEADDTQPASTQNEAAEVTYTISGAIDVEGSGNFMLFCDDGDGITDPFIEIGYLNGSELLSLTVMTTASGTVDVLGSDEPGANPGQANYVSYRTSDMTQYELGSGQLVIDLMPSAEGDRFVATLNAELQDEDGNTITLEANYDGDAGMQSFDDCAE